MIVWGSGTATINLGPAETKHCHTCDATRPFTVMVIYRYWGLYWIFNMVTQKRHMEVCGACGRGADVPDNRLEPRCQAAPIPFMRRFGLAALLGTVFGLPTFISLITVLLSGVK